MAEAVIAPATATAQATVTTTVGKGTGVPVRVGFGNGTPTRRKHKKAATCFDANGEVRRAASGSAAFEAVDEGVVPPLHAHAPAPAPAPEEGGGDDDDDSNNNNNNKRGRTTAVVVVAAVAVGTAAPGRASDVARSRGPPDVDDGRWNLAAATLATFPTRFVKLSDARKSVRRGEVHAEGAIRRGDYRPRPGERLVIFQRTSAGKSLDRAELPPDLPPLFVAYEDEHMVRLPSLVLFFTHRGGMRICTAAFAPPRLRVGLRV